MKKIYRNFYGLALAALIGGMATSCTNELNEPTMNQGGTLGNMKLVHTPDVYAWSGDQVIGQGMPSFLTRAGEGTSYEYTFGSEMSTLENLSLPSQYEIFQDNWDFINSHQDFNGALYIPAGETRTYDVPNHFNGTLYIAGTYTPNCLGNNSNGMNVVVLDGGSLTFNNVNNNEGKIFNAGTVHLNGNLENTKFPEIYNSGELFITNQWYKGQVTVASGVSIYSTGYVEFEGDNTLINGSIVSNDIVKTTGNVKFQSSGYRDICWLQATGDIEITDQDNTFGQMDGQNMKFDGAKVTLHPDGFVNIANKIEITNSGCAIKPMTQALVKCNVLNILNTGEQATEIFPSGIYLNVPENNITYNPDNVNGLAYVKGLINTSITMQPACGASSEPEVPEEPQVKECPKCHHPEHGDECEECEEGDPCRPKPEEPVQPEDPNKYKKGTDEVEVNFSINDVHNDPEGAHYDNADLWTKLSIHVRKATDVKIFIPLASKYLCESDDFNIFQTHQPVEGLYTGSGDNSEKSEGSSLSPTYTHSMDYVVNGQWTVTLNITITDEGIYVETKGINDNQDLIDYLFETNGDGMNFEIWFYFQTETVKYFTDEDGNETSSVVGTLTQAEYDNFQNVLNGSTIEFKYNEPDFYINAFNDVDSTGEKFVGDCTVTIVSDQKSDYNDYFEGVHFNDSPYNHIYKLKSAEKPHPAEN